LGPVPGVSFVLSYCILFFPKCKDRLPQGGLLFLFTRKEKEAKRKAARAIKIKVQNLGLQALAYALCLGEAEGRAGRDSGGTPVLAVILSHLRQIYHFSPPGRRGTGLLRKTLQLFHCKRTVPGL
jgi:hypothetical protein